MTDSTTPSRFRARVNRRGHKTITPVAEQPNQQTSEALGAMRRPGRRRPVHIVPATADGPGATMGAPADPKRRETARSLVQRAILIWGDEDSDFVRACRTALETPSAEVEADLDGGNDGMAEVLAQVNSIQTGPMDEPVDADQEPFDWNGPASGQDSPPGTVTDQEVRDLGESDGPPVEAAPETTGDGDGDGDAQETAPPAETEPAPELNPTPAPGPGPEPAPAAASEPVTAVATVADPETDAVDASEAPDSENEETLPETDPAQESQGTNEEAETEPAST